MNFTSVKALLFDLGGVVIDIDFDIVFARWAACANKSMDEIKSKFLFDSFYEAHERGEISSEEYFDSLRKRLQIDISDVQFKEGWNSIFKGEVQGMTKLLKQAKDRLPIYAFTNSNELHQAVWSEKFSPILSHFRWVFNSSRIGKRKPDPAAFKMIVDAIGVSPEQIVFYDDSIENIAGAQKTGLTTVHVKSVMDVAASLHDILKPTTFG